MNRRLFLKSIAAVSPLALLSGCFDNLLQKAYLLQRGEKSELRTYVMFNMYGGPARWVFDNNLRPNGSDEIHFSKSIYTGFSDDGRSFYDPNSTPFEYATIPYKNWHVPKLWGSKVFFRGELVPMTNLLEHMWSFRGVNQGINAHPVGNVRQICVRNGDTSISGLVADSSKRPIPAISLGEAPANTSFCSETGTTQLDLSYRNSSPNDNLIHFLTSPFLNNKSENPLNLPADFDPIAEYERLVKKYSTILTKTKELCPIPGLTDRPIRTEEFSAPTKKELLASLGKFHFDVGYILSKDYSETFANARASADQNLEIQFALAEFVLVNKISSSLVLSPPTGREITLSGIATDHLIKERDLKIIEENGRFKVDLAHSNPASKKDLNVIMDAHNMGSFYNVLGSSHYFQGMSACLLELVQVLKDHSTASEDLFANVVIHLASEFDRSVRAADGETGHWPAANPTSLISGMIKEHNIVGNILVKSSLEEIPVTLGDAAPVEEIGGLVHTENILSSITTVLGGRELSFRNPSILKVSHGLITTQLSRPKNIS